MGAGCAGPGATRYGRRDAPNPFKAVRIPARRREKRLAARGVWVEPDGTDGSRSTRAH